MKRTGIRKAGKTTEAEIHCLIDGGHRRWKERIRIGDEGKWLFVSRENEFLSWTKISRENERVELEAGNLTDYRKYSMEWVRSAHPGRDLALTVGLGREKARWLIIGWWTGKKTVSCYLINDFFFLHVDFFLILKFDKF